MYRLVAVLTAGLLAAAACRNDITGTSELEGPAFAHESNNAAELTSTRDPSLGGTAIVNFVGGNIGWRSTVNVTGDLPAGTFEVILTRPGFPDQMLCDFTVIGSGSRQGCTTDRNVAGFAGVEVRDGDGRVVVSGTFARRGGMRLTP